MRYFLRNNDVDFLHRHCGYRKMLIEVSACFKDNGRMRSNVYIQCLPEKYEDTSAELYRIIFDKKPDKDFEKIYSCKK